MLYICLVLKGNGHRQIRLEWNKQGEWRNSSGVKNGTEEKLNNWRTELVYKYMAIYTKDVWLLYYS